MKKIRLRSFILVSVLMSLSACFGPKTPQEVAQAFWKAVMSNDAGDAVEYSTLTDKDHYDSLSKDWTGYRAAWGRVVIDGDKANIVSEFTAPANSGSHNRQFITYLVKQNDGWKVDYDRTKMAVRGGVLGDLLDKLSQLGDKVSQQMNTSTDDFNQQMNRMSKKLEQMADSFNAEATKSVNKFAEELQKSIEQLEESINRALKDDNNMSDHDRHVLQAAAVNLHQDNERLAQPSVEAVGKSSMNIGKTQQQIDTLNSDSLNKYKIEWHDLAMKIQNKMQNMLDELSYETENKNS